MVFLESLLSLLVIAYFCVFFVWTAYQAILTPSRGSALGDYVRVANRVSNGRLYHQL